MKQNVGVNLIQVVKINHCSETANSGPDHILQLTSIEIESLLRATYYNALVREILI